MTSLAPLCVAVPLLAAGTITAFGHFAHSRLVDAAGLAGSTAVAVMAAFLLRDSAGGTLVHWAGGWEPRDGLAVGIPLVADPYAAGLVLLSGVLVTATFAFSWRYFEEAGALFHVLVLVFLAATAGFALAGDLFTLFVFFELMSVAAFALTAYRSDETGPLQGAINFATTNSVGAILVLFGIGLLYGETGTLNLAQLGRAVAAGSDERVVVAAFVLLATGFLVKAAVVPFHFWLADAYAVAPAPVCVLFSALMSDLGLYALARVYWTVFSDGDAVDPALLRGVLLALGVATALVGAAMCFLQSQLKRLLAFATISHIGIFLVGIALLTPEGLAGAALYVLADGLVKAGLFLAVGIVIHRLESGEELELRGRGRALPVTGVVFALGGLGLAALPPSGTFLGKSLVEEAAVAGGRWWLAVALVWATALTGGAVLRATGRVFLGFGPARDVLVSLQPDEEERQEPQPPASVVRPALMAMPAGALVLAGLALSLVPGLADAAHSAAERFQDRGAYAAVLLEGVEREQPEATAPPLKPSALVLGLVSTVGAVGLAWLALFRRAIPRRARAQAWRFVRPPLRALSALHSGHPGDYIAWLAAGAALVGAVLALGPG